MTLLVFAEVVMRFGFGSGELWIQELTLYLSAWFVMFGISYGLKVGAHIGVDAVVKLLPTGLQRIASSIAVILCLVYCGLFLYGSWVYLGKMYRIGIGMEDVKAPLWFVHMWSEQTLEAWKIDPEDPLVPLWFSQSILIVGLSLFSIRLLELLWAIVIGKETGFRHKDEAEESMHLAEQLAAEKEQAK
jgi:C4-dicarboxylate transporter DctQ subunit